MQKSRIMQKLLLLLVIIFDCISSTEDKPLSYVLRDEKFYRHVSSERQIYLREYIDDWNDLIKACKQEIINEVTPDKAMTEVMDAITNQLKDIWGQFGVNHIANVYIFDDVRVVNSVKELFKTAIHLFAESELPTQICNDFLWIFHYFRMKAQFYDLYDLMKDGNIKYGGPDIRTYSHMIKSIPDFQTNYDEANKLFHEYFDCIEANEFEIDKEFLQPVFKSFLAYDDKELLLRENEANWNMIQEQFQRVSQHARNSKYIKVVQKKFKFHLVDGSKENMDGQRKRHNRQRRNRRHGASVLGRIDP